MNRFKTIDDFRVDEPSELNNADSAGSLKQGGNKKRHRSSSENDSPSVVAMIS